jgi:hypothetical protein
MRMEVTRTRSASLVGSVKDWLELIISFLIQGWSMCLSGPIPITRQPTRGGTRVDYIINHFRDHHVRLRVFLDCTSIYRIITSSLLLFRDARLSEAENSLGLKKEVACISLRHVQARQYCSIRSVRWIIMFFLLPFSTRHILVTPT